MADVEARVALSWLMDFYAPLLTPHRRELMRLYCEEDLSLGEIAEQLRITRQGVSDALKKAKAQLEDYEAKLGLAVRERRLRERAGECLAALENIEVSRADAPRLDAARRALNEIINEG